MAKKVKKDKTWVLQAQIISAARKAFMHSPMFAATKKASQEEYTTYNQDGSVSNRRRVHYVCAICGKRCKDITIEVPVLDAKGNPVINKKTGKPKIKKYHEFEVDHTIPVTDETGFPRRLDGKPDWNKWFDSLFVDMYFFDPKIHSYKDFSNRLRVLCHECHAEVTREQQSSKKKVKSTTKTK